MLHAVPTYDSTVSLVCCRMLQLEQKGIMLIQNGAHPMSGTHPVVVTVHKAAEEEKLDASLKAEHGLLCHLGSQAPLGGSIALLDTGLNGMDNLSF